MSETYVDGMKEIPASACEFLGDVEITDANGQAEQEGKGSQSAPFRMVARTGAPIDHPFWGKIVHDMRGMFIPENKTRVAIDYCHKNDEVIGYANHFNSETGDLEASGALTPYKDGDRAHEVIFKAQQGIPWQSSINWGGSGIRLQALGKGETEFVNNQEVVGPAVIARRWPLRGISVCPYGADQGTSTEFSRGDTVAVSYQEKEPEMATDVKDPIAEQEEKINEMLGGKEPDKELTTAAPEEGDKPVESETDNDSGEAAAPAAAVEPQKEFAPYKKQFGLEQGAIYFAEGVPFHEALGLHVKKLQARLDELEAANADDGPVKFSEHKEPKKKVNPMQLPEGF